MRVQTGMDKNRIPNPRPPIKNFGGKPPIKNFEGRLRGDGAAEPQNIEG